MGLIETHFDGLKRGTDEAWLVCDPELVEAGTSAIWSELDGVTDDEVDPAVRDAISITWENRDSAIIETPAKLRGYLRTTAKNNVRKHRRRHRREVPYEEGLDELLTVEPKLPASSVIPYKVLAECLTEAMGQLDEKNRIRIESFLHPGEQKVYADILGVGVGNMSNYERTALSKLRKSFVKILKPKVKPEMSDKEFWKWLKLHRDKKVKELNMLLNALGILCCGSSSNGKELFLLRTLLSDWTDGLRVSGKLSMPKRRLQDSAGAYGFVHERPEAKLLTSNLNPTKILIRMCNSTLKATESPKNIQQYSLN